jgi:inosose dehydratase
LTTAGPWLTLTRQMTHRPVFQQHRIKVADAPVNWGVYGFDPARPMALTGDVFLDHVRHAGYDGVELGPPGFMGDALGTRDALADRNLLLVGAYLDLRFSRQETITAELAALAERARFVAEAAPAGATPFAVLSDSTAEPDRLAVAGRAEQHPATWLDGARFETLISNIHRAAEVCHTAGLLPVLHPHAGTYVETDREIRQVCDRLDGSLVGLCLDTGHAWLGGADPLALLRDYGPLVRHVHLKDVAPDVLAESRREGWSMEETWERGIFCDLGSGEVPIVRSVAELQASGYQGWAVVEQDRVLHPGESPDAAAATSLANRDFLAANGLPR